MSTQKNIALLTIVIWIGMISGCGVSTSDLVSLSQGMSPPNPNEILGQGFKEVDPDSSQPAVVKVVNKASMPSPERSNPFELSGEYREEANGQTPGRKKEIRILGFVEVDEPMVMLSVDGKTQLLKVGQTEMGITANEVRSPNVKLSYDGVTWNASLFDRRN